MADTSAPLSKVDSAVEHGDAVGKKISHRRASSSAAGVKSMADLGMFDLSGVAIVLFTRETNETIC
jgi:hypothetical protein